jgi:O-methyltransferase
LATRDRRAVLAFLAAREPVGVTLRDRVRLVHQYVRITNATRGYHAQAEVLAVADAILRLKGREGLVVVEAGAGKGASTAKLSLATALAGGRLVVFDSFRGMPPNNEVHVRLDGTGPVVFRAGAFDGSLTAVRRVVETQGNLAVCEFHKGWLEETLPAWDGHVDVALLDVDLLASTRTCLRYLVPRLRPGGVLFTQDAHLRAVAELIGDARFWREEVGVAPPRVEGLMARKMVSVRPG